MVDNGSDGVENHMRLKFSDLIDVLEAMQTPVVGYERYQPCGCVLCICENEERCYGCGAKNCTIPKEKHPSLVKKQSDSPELKPGYVPEEDEGTGHNFIGNIPFCTKCGIYQLIHPNFGNTKCNPKPSEPTLEEKFEAEIPAMRIVVNQSSDCESGLWIFMENMAKIAEQHFEPMIEKAHKEGYEFGKHILNSAKHFDNDQANKSGFEAGKRQAIEEIQERFNFLISQIPQYEGQNASFNTVRFLKRELFGDKATGA